MPRVRQFSCERSQNFNHKIYDKSTQLHTPKRPKTSQFATPRSQISSSRSIAASSRYICNNCFNQDLSSNKKDRQRRQKQKDKLIYGNVSTFGLQHNPTTYFSKRENQVRDFNQKAAEDKKMKKKKELLETRKETMETNYILEQEQKYYNTIQLEKKQKIRENFRQQIEEQIKNRKNKKAQEHTKIENFVKNQSALQREQQIKHRNYRQDLIQQIRANAQHKKHKKLQQKLQNQLAIVEEAHQKELRRQAHIEQLRQDILKDAKRRENQANMQKKYELQQKQLWKQEEAQRAKELELERNDYNALKQRQIQDYLQNLKEQIQSNKQNKMKQYLEEKRNTDNTITISEPIVLKKGCNKCDRVFPKSSMTKIRP